MAMNAANNKNHGALNASCPVCGSDNTNGLTLRHSGDAYEVCDVECREEFESDPDAYSKDG